MQAKNKNTTLSSFAVLISYLLAYLQLLLFKLNRDYDVFGRNSCLGYPCILPHVLLSVSTFPVVATDFSGPRLIRSRNSFSLRYLAQQVGAAVSQPPFISPNAAITILHLSRSPLPCPWLFKPISSCRRAIPHGWLGLPVRSARPHASVPALMWGKKNSLYNWGQRR